MEEQQQKEDPENIMEEMFNRVSKTSGSPNIELFEAEEHDVDLKTDVVYPEDVLLSTLKFNDDFLEECGIERIYDDYINSLMRIRFSLDRKSRIEFSDTSKQASLIGLPSAVDNVSESRK